jgi:hypothetical protein
MGLTGIVSALSVEPRSPHSSLRVVTGAMQNAVAVAEQLLPPGDIGSGDSFFASLEIERQLFDGLQPLLAKEGFRLERKNRSHRFTRDYGYTAVCDSEKECAALLQLPSDVLRSESDSVIGQFLMVLKAFRGVPTRFLGESELTFPFREALADEWKSDQDWYFIPRSDVENTIRGKILYRVLNVFKLMSPAARRNDAHLISQADLEPIIKTLAKLATNTPGGAAGYFENLVKNSEWPDDWKSERQGGWSGNANAGASNIVTYALGKTFPAGHLKAGQSVLGWLLFDVVTKTTAGGAEQTQFSRFILENDLLNNEESIKLLREKIVQ